MTCLAGRMREHPHSHLHLPRPNVQESLPIQEHIHRPEDMYSSCLSPLCRSHCHMRGTVEHRVALTEHSMVWLLLFLAVLNQELTLELVETGKCDCVIEEEFSGSCC